MKKIASFMVDHNKLTEGMYTSRVDGDITTYDIRVVRPNNGCYLDNDSIHTFEHLFATYVRNSDYEKSIIYVGPMGCRTGFYLLVRDLSPEDSIKLVQESMDFIANYEGKIPGRSAVECGNYIEHNLEGANAIARSMQPILKDWTVKILSY
ncbi:MAG: S-ribosylhomocysteine lyase [Oscillospiraceae bacterium]